MQQNYREQLFNGIVQVIENSGKGDKDYDGFQKSRDILEILELILANSILATSIDKATIRESCEESYMNIRKIALALYQEDHPEEEKNQPDPIKKSDSKLTSLKKKSDFAQTNRTLTTF